MQSDTCGAGIQKMGTLSPIRSEDWPSRLKYTNGRH